MYLSTGFLGKSECPLPQSSMPRLSVPFCGVRCAAGDTLPCPCHGIPKDVSLAQFSELQESVLVPLGSKNASREKGNGLQPLCQPVPSSYTGWVHGQRLQGSAVSCEVSH